MGDRIMTNLLALIQNGAKQPTVLEDAFFTIGAVIAAFETDFDKYLGAFLPFMVEGLRNHKEYQLCSISVGLIGDICRALGENSAKYCDDFMNALFANLQSPQLNRSVKPTILSCFGDMDDRNNWAELQGNLCSALMACVRRLGRKPSPIGNRLTANLLLLIIQTGVKQPNVHQSSSSSNIVH